MPPPLHILLVYRSAYPLVKGGVDALLANLIQGLHPHHRLSLFIPGEWSDHAWQQLERGGITVLNKRLRLWADRHRRLRGWLGGMWEFPATLAALYRYCRQERVDVVHLFTVQEYHLYFRLLHRLGGPPYVVTGVGSDFLKFPVNNAVVAPRLAAVLREASALTAVAPHLAEALVTHLPGLARPRVIINGINPATVEPGPAALVPVLPLRYFVLVADIDRGKGQDVAIRAWGQLAHRLPDVHLLIIGVIPILSDTQDYYDGLHRLLVSEGCGERVQIIPVMERATMLAVAAGSLGLLLPTRGEGFPYVLLESGVLALPTIFSAIRPFTDFLVDGEHTLLVPLDDPAALADRVARLANDRPLAARLASNLRQLVTSRFAAQTMADQYGALYGEVASRFSPIR